MSRETREAAHRTAEAEALEQRRLLAASIIEGILVGRGTESADTFALRRSGAAGVILTINGVDQTFDMNDFTGVRLAGLGGGDTFDMIDPLVSPVVRNTTVVGGAGRDTLSYATHTGELEFHIDPSGPSPSPFPGVPPTPGVSGPGGQRDVFSAVETFIGGSGDDRFIYRQGNAAPAGGLTAVRLEGRGGDDTFIDAIEVTTGDAYAGVTAVGGDGNDEWNSGLEMPRESFFGDAGNDEARVIGSNAGTLNGGTGNDTIRYSSFGSNPGAVHRLADTPGFENARASRGTLIGTDGPNRLELNNGGTIRGGGGNDTLTGGDDAELLDGGDGDDTIGGFAGDDTIDGGAGRDTVDSGPGNDVIVNAEVTPPRGTINIANRVIVANGTWGGEDIRIEDAGDEVIVRIDNFSRHFDKDDFDGVLLRGNNGWDRIEVARHSGPPFVAGVTMDGGNGNDSLFGFTGDDLLRGGPGIDLLNGDDGNDRLFGGLGSFDDLNGGRGNDLLDGGDGDDWLNGSGDRQADTLIGGEGRDRGFLGEGDIHDVEEPTFSPGG